MHAKLVLLACYASRVRGVLSAATVAAALAIKMMWVAAISTAGATIATEMVSLELRLNAREKMVFSLNSPELVAMFAPELKTRLPRKRMAADASHRLTNHALLVLFLPEPDALSAVSRTF
jgi:hypothetical protein